MEKMNEQLKYESWGLMKFGWKHVPSCGSVSSSISIWNENMVRVVGVTNLQEPYPFNSNWRWIISNVNGSNDYIETFAFWWGAVAFKVSMDQPMVIPCLARALLFSVFFLAWVTFDHLLIFFVHGTSLGLTFISENCCAPSIRQGQHLVEWISSSK